MTAFSFRYEIIQFDPVDVGMGLVDEFVNDYINDVLKKAFNGKECPILPYEILDECFGNALENVFDGKNCPYIQEIYGGSDDSTYVISSKEIPETEAMKAFCEWEDSQNKDEAEDE